MSVTHERTVDEVLPGHWRALALLEDTPRVRETLSLYERAIGHPVYLRPTNKGLTVISLDPRPSAMVGVGGAKSGDCAITVLPPGAAHVGRVVQAYHAKVASMRRRSSEEQFVVARIRSALENGLRLSDDLIFVHHEWRLFGSGKIDLLAIDMAGGQLVVIEAKGSETAARSEVDRRGRTASQQSAEYAAEIARHAGVYVPYFSRLAAALARVYRNGEVLAANPTAPPRWEVWWPGGRIPGSRKAMR